MTADPNLDSVISKNDFENMFAMEKKDASRFILQFFKWFEKYFPNFFPACPKGTFKPSTEPGDKRSCQPCPNSDQTSPLGSWEISQCKCRDGYQMFQGK